MDNLTASSVAHPNIAFIKYWGDVDPSLHIPANGSISMNLQELYTRTQVRFDPDFEGDQFSLNGRLVEGYGLTRVSDFLERVRQMAGMTPSLRPWKATTTSRQVLGLPRLHLVLLRSAWLLRGQQDWTWMSAPYPAWHAPAQALPAAPSRPGSSNGRRAAATRIAMRIRLHLTGTGILWTASRW